MWGFLVLGLVILVAIFVDKFQIKSLGAHKKNKNTVIKEVVNEISSETKSLVKKGIGDGIAEAKRLKLLVESGVLEKAMISSQAEVFIAWMLDEHVNPTENYKNYLNASLQELADFDVLSCPSCDSDNYVLIRYIEMKEFWHTRNEDWYGLSRTMLEDKFQYGSVCLDCNTVFFKEWNKQNSEKITHQRNKAKPVRQDQETFTKGFDESEHLKKKKNLIIRSTIRPTHCTFCNGSNIAKSVHSGVGSPEVKTDAYGLKFINHGDLVSADFTHWECTDCKSGYRIENKGSFFL